MFALSSYLGLASDAVPDNPFTGTIPTSLGALTGLTELNLAGTAVNGTIPSQLANIGGWLALPYNPPTVYVADSPVVLPSSESQLVVLVQPR